MYELESIYVHVRTLHTHTTHTCIHTIQIKERDCTTSAQTHILLRELHVGRERGGEGEGEGGRSEREKERIKQ